MMPLLMRALSEILVVVTGLLTFAGFFVKVMRPRIERWLGIEPKKPKSSHLQHIRELEAEIREMDEIRKRNDLTGEN